MAARGRVFVFLSLFGYFAWAQTGNDNLKYVDPLIGSANGGWCRESLSARLF